MDLESDGSAVLVTVSLVVDQVSGVCYHYHCGVVLARLLAVVLVLAGASGGLSLDLVLVERFQRDPWEFG